MQTRLGLLLIALFGALPYVSTIKLPPIATFWPEWVAVVLTGCWLAVQGRSSAPHVPNDERATNVAGQAALAVPIPVLGFLAACAVLLVQLLAHQPLFVGAPLIAVGVLTLAALMCLAGERVRASGDAARLLDAWSIGLLVAMALNLVAVLLDRAGLFVYVYQIVPRPTQLRADGLIGQPNQLATLAVLATLAGDYLWMRGKLPAIGKLILGAVVALVLAVAASRAGMLLWVLATVLSALALRSHARRSAGRRLLAANVALFVAIQVLWHFIGTVSPDAGGARVLSAGSNQERIELLRDSWALIQLHPFSGVGYGNFMAARWNELTSSLLEPTSANAHNLVAQLLVEFGIPGAALVLIPMGWGVWRCAKASLQRQVAPERFLAAAVVLVLALYSMFEFPLWHTYFLLPFALALGLVEQRDLVLQVSAVTPSLRRLGWAMGVVLCVALAWDYHRSESLSSSLREQQSRRAAAAGIEIQKASDIALLSAFDQWANLMYARTLDADGSFVDHKLAVTERAMLTLTGRETIARHVAFLVAADQSAAARDLILRTRRTPGLERETRATLDLLVPKIPALKAFVASLPAMPPPDAP